ncbi:MAG: methylenetetrahydrofolate reductase [NAD(P)H], partial [Actinobacteria bacterium]|nr:methylenetetrahydrofolate reductase [NAD(P)H] [Actinomycetota bacterium]
MSRICDLLAAGRTYSFEFFPPRTDAGERNLRDTLNELEPLGPSFVSVTYGAGGSTRERTHRIVVDLLERTSMTPMAHLTSVSHTRAELNDILARYRDAGVENILALRGDPPQDDPDATPTELRHAIELVELAREVGGDRFSVGVAAHPEVHPLSPDRTSDRRHLAAKLCAADFGITQFFFRAEDYLRMVDELAALGCDTPVLPGVMPVTDVRQIQRFAELSGAAFPSALAERFLAVEEDETAVRELGVETATELCRELLDAGAPGLHFYTLNRSTATREIHANLGLSGG